MKKWKKVALALTAAMMFTTIFGVTACKKGGSDNPGGPGGGEEPGGPGPGPSQTVDTKVELRDDTRAEAYVVYKPDGSELGKFKTLAAAINAAVEFDEEEDEFGSYVRKVGGRHNLFTNRAGYEGTGEGNDDTYWYYEEGTKLAMVDCWESEGGLTSVLQNSDYVVNKISSYGTDSIQSWNSYRVLDQDGDPMDWGDKFARTYELSSTMDASMLAFPKRLNGVTKQTYKLDLSDVRITPPFKGADDTYAFMGFYNWQDYYVIDIGIACDTSTGVWYPFIATSRDDSFSDAEYKFDETAIMKSTWNAEGHYFKPDLTGLTMAIETQRLEDPRDGSLYQSNYFTISTATGEKLYEYRIEEEATQEYFSTGIGMENTYVFNAGLDIKSELGFDNTHVKAVDYFNGAAFENLKITSAEWYFPTEEEVPNDVYGPEIEDDLRGKTFDVVLAKADKESLTGVYDYVLLNNSYFVDYSQINGADVYSFSFNKSATADEEFAGDLAGYQGAIDELIGVTEDTVVDFADKITEMNKWDSVTVPTKYYQLLDFAPLRAASELLTAVMTISDDAKAVKNDFLALENIDQYNIKGWVAPADTAIKGYIWSEIQKFEEIQAAYGDLSEEDQNNLKFHIDMAKFEKWSTLAEEMTAAVEALEEDTTKVKLGENGQIKTLPGAYTDHDAIDVLTELVYWANAVKTWAHWPEGISPDGDKLYGEGTPVSIYVMDTNANWYASVKIVYCYQILKDRLDAAGVDVPTWIEDILDDIKYDNFYEGVYYPLYGTVLAGLKVSNNKWQNDDELEEFLNDVWGPDYTIATEIYWNWNSGNRFRTYMTTRSSYLIKIVLLQNPELSNAAFKLYKSTQINGTWTWVVDAAGTEYQIFDYYAAVGNMLKDVFGFELHTNDWGIKQGTIDLEVNVSDEAQAVIDMINALPLLDESYLVIGWTAPAEAPADGEAPAGYYYYDNIEAARAAKTAYDALEAADVVAVSSYTNVKNYNAWTAEAAALALITGNSAYETATFKVPNKVKDGGTAEEPTYKEDDTNVATFIPGVYSEKTAEYALTYLLFQATTTRTTEQGVITTYSANNNRSARIALFYEFLTEELEATLTPYMQSLLEAIKFNEWYEQVWTPITGLMDIEQKLTGDDAYTSMTNFSEAELKFLNDYYTTAFTMGDLLKKYYVTGVPADAGEPSYGPAMTEGSFGHKLRLMMQSYAWSQEYPIPAGTARALLDTLENINEFLQSKGYPIAGNKWGVASAKILGEDLDETVGAVVALITPVGDIASEDYVAKGWEAGSDEAITGYIYSEYLAYKDFKVAYGGLTDTQKEKADIFISATVLASWDVFAPELEALMKDAAWETFTFSYAVHANMGKVGADFGYQYFSGTTLAENQANGMAIVNLMKWTKSITTNPYWNSANHLGNPTDSVAVPFTDMYWIYRQLDKAGLATKLPTVVKSQYNAVVSHFGNGAGYIQDLDYLFGAAEIMLKIEDKTATVAEIVNLVNTYMVDKKAWNDGGMGWAYAAPGSYPRVDQALQRYFKLANTTTVITPINAILAVIPDVPTVAYTKAGFSPIGVSRQITAEDVQYSADPGYTTTQSGTLLPQFNKDWGINAGIDASGASDMTLASDSEGYKFTATKAGDFASMSTLMSKSFAVKGNALHYKLKVTGDANGDGQTADIVFYVKNGESRVYFYLGEQFETPSKNKITGEVEGSITLAQIQAWLVANKSYNAAANIEIVAIRPYMYNGVSMTISELYIESLPGYQAPQQGNILPEYTAEWKVRETDSTATVTETTDGYKFAPATNDWTFFDAAVGMNNVTVAGNSLYLDIKVDAIAKDGANNYLDVIVYFGDAKNTEFACYGGTISTKYQLVAETGTYQLEAKFADLKQNAVANKGLDASLTALDVKGIAVYAFGGTDVTISALYVGKSTPDGYADGHDDSLLPGATTGWTVRESDSKAKVVATENSYKFTPVAGAWTFYDTKFTDKTVTVDGSALYIDLKVNEVAKDNGNCLDIIVYFDNATNTKFACVAGAIGTKYQLVGEAGTYHFEVPFTQLRKNAADNKGLDGTLAQLDIKGIAVYAYGGTEVEINALYVGDARTTMEGDLLPLTKGGWVVDSAIASTTSVAIDSDTEAFVFTTAANDANTAGWYATAQVNREFNVANNVLAFSFTGTTAYDVLVYLNDTSTYVYFSDKICGKAGHGNASQVMQSGEVYQNVISLADLMKIKGLSGDKVTITQIKVRVFGAGTITLNTMAVMGVEYIRTDVTEDWTANGYVDANALSDGKMLSYMGFVQSNLASNWNSVMIEVRSTGDNYNSVSMRADNFTWDFVGEGKTDFLSTTTDGDALKIKNAADEVQTYGADEAGVAAFWADYGKIAKDAMWSVVIMMDGNEISVEVQLMALSGELQGYKFACGYTITIDATKADCTSYNVFLSADAVKAMSVVAKQDLSD